LLLCDADGDGIVGVEDFGIMSSEWGSTTGGLADCDGDTFVGVEDFGILSATWLQQKGPSGITNPSRDYAECP
jgi:hypothetical protein